MVRIGLRELSHHTARVVARVRKGETIQVTDHGRPVLRLVPEMAAESAPRAELLASGLVAVPAVELGPFPPPPPLRPDEASGPTLTETLRDMRDAERY